MQLVKFKTFLNEVEKDDALMHQVKNIEIYRYFNETWFDKKDSVLENKDICKDLLKTLKKKSHWRYPNSSVAYFPLEEYSAVVRVTYLLASTKPTREKFASELEKCIERANNAFDATHDILTGLLNNQAFMDETNKIIKLQGTAEPIEADSVVSTISTKTAVLLAIDVDNFKQVNDTYGHIYGDIVLKCLSRRLEGATQNLLKDNRSILSIEVGRPSGEEFLVLLYGQIDFDLAKKAAEYFRHTIAKDALPTDDEWNAVLEPGSEDSVNLPQVMERQITISIGISTLISQGSMSSSNPFRVYRNQADRALYCAKAGGKNTIRQYNDILNKYGTILEHDADNNVVTIDIGKEVNVRNGQEFLVYHEKFTGNVPFTQDDGRTRKTLGTYPRVPIGRIIVFDSQ